MDQQLRLRQDARIQDAFLREQRGGIQLASIVRVIALVVILLWALSIDVNRENVSAYIVLGLLCLSSGAMWAISRLPAYRPWHLYLFVLLDHALIAYAIATPWIVGGVEAPMPLSLRSVWFSIFFLFIAGAAIAQTPGVVVWSGVSAALCWSSVVLHALRDPNSFTIGNEMLFGNPDLQSFLAVYLDPNFVDLTSWFSQIMLLILVSLTLAKAVKRSRRLVENQVVVERERANLARYFSPDVVDRLATKDSPLSQPQTRTVAVLFADLVGFTRLCENAPPEEVIALLSGFRQRMERAVFDNGGTVDKYIGDCVMATFGLLQSTPDNAAAAVACAHQMLDAVEDWNRERATMGLAPLALGVGAHYGPVTAGDIGGDRRVEFTVIGDTVNVASRLTHMTRDLDADLVISADLAEAARGTLDAAALERFRRADNMAIRGREGAMAIWYHRRSEDGASRDAGICAA